MLIRSVHSSGCRTQRGLSLVEMMVGIAIGLIVVAAASLIVSAQLADNRRLLIEAQMQQDLRATMDIMTRELRRLGAQTDIEALSGIWTPRVPPAVQPVANAYAASVSASAPGTAVDNVEFDYNPGGQVGTTRFGFKLDDGTISSLIGNGWQALTDAGVLKVTALSITPVHSQQVMRLPCANVCPAGGSACWPDVQVREFRVSITAESLPPTVVTRTLVSNVRLRNEYVRFNTGTGQICPS